MRKYIPLIVGLILIFITLWLQTTSNKPVRLFIDQLDNISYDIQLRTYVMTHHFTPKSPVAIIDIDDKSLAKEGRWPWPRNKLAQLVDELHAQGAAVIAFDVLFSEKENNIADTIITKLSSKNLLNAAIADVLKKNQSLFDDDSIFGKSINDTTTVLALSFLPRTEYENNLPPPILTLSPEDQTQLQIVTAHGYISNIPVLQNAAKASGFINIFPDSDGVLRRAPLVMNYQGGIYPSLSLQAVMLFLGESAELFTPRYHNKKQIEGIKLGATMIPTDGLGQALIPYIGKSYTFPYFSATDVLHRKVAKDALQGTIAFVGTSATGLGDLKPTAIQNSFPGVEVQASMAEGILENGFSSKPEWTFGAIIFLTFTLGLIAAYYFPKFGPKVLTGIVVFFPPALVLLNNIFWNLTGITISLFMPIALVLLIAIFNTIYGYLFESRRRERLKEMFGQYVPEKHIDQMLEATGGYGLKGEDRQMTVLFADLRDFTNISEDLSAKDLVQMLNEYFTPMTEIIFKHRGTIDKYVGDLIMAFWGAPLADKSHATHALRSALEMQAKLKEMNAKLILHNWPPLRIGIGINSGIMSVGDMGSKYRRNYTVMGDAVNLGSRVESLSKYYGVDIIATESTIERQTNFIFRRLDRVRVKGKTKGVEIYEVVCFARDLTRELENELRIYDLALAAYFEQKWDVAYTHMNELSTRYPDSKLYSMYLDRIKQFKEHPLPADWDGVYVHATK